MALEKEPVTGDSSQEVIFVSVRLTRSDFGKGRLGEEAWQMIKTGATCVARIGSEFCDRPAIGTTDFDMGGEAMLYPHCSEAHHRLISLGVEEELRQEGKRTDIGRNGFGRSKG